MDENFSWQSFKYTNMIIQGTPLLHQLGIIPLCSAAPVPGQLYMSSNYGNIGTLQSRFQCLSVGLST